MKKINYCLLTLVMLSCGTVTAQQSTTQNDYWSVEAQRNRQQIEDLRTQVMLMESHRRTQEMLNETSSKPSFLEQLAKDAEEARLKKEAEDAAEQVKHQNAVALAQTRNQTLYLFILLATVTAIGFVLKKRKGEKSMTAQEKSGVLTMTLAAILPFTSLLFHVVGWLNERDILSNLFQANVVIGGEQKYSNYTSSPYLYYDDALLTFPLGWLVFSGVMLGAYGILLFTGVVKSPSWLCKWLEAADNH